MTSVKIVQDSYWIDSTGKRHRLTTMVATYQRFFHSEVMTHRKLSRNAASSRAIPVAKLVSQVIENPAMPIFWGKNQPGMQAYEEVDEETRVLAVQEWLAARDHAVAHARRMIDWGIHKQIANRLLEPFQWMVAIISATDWGNFYGLRRVKYAQPEFKLLADVAYDAHTKSVPRLLKPGEWTLPFITDEERANYPIDILRKASVARCARVSYLNHDGTTPNIEKDLSLHDMLALEPHASPFEHVATPTEGNWGNFTGFKQYRQLLSNENITEYPGI